MQVKLDLKTFWQRTPHGRYIWRLCTRLQVQLNIEGNRKPFDIPDVLIDTGSPYTIIPAMYWDPAQRNLGKELETMNVAIGGADRPCAVTDAAIFLYDSDGNVSPEYLGKVLLAHGDQFDLTILGMDFLLFARLVCNPSKKNEMYLEFED